MDIEVILERHEQRIKTLERDMNDIKEVQAEIRSMNETLVTLANELKHTNEHLARHEQKIKEIDALPRQRIQQIITAIGDRVVIDKNEDGTNSICSAINEKFLTLVKSARKENSSHTQSGCPYRVKVTTSCLNIRQGAGSDTKKVGAIIDYGVYTIIEEKNGVGATLWGRLKSGVGWISLDYVQKL